MKTSIEWTDQTWGPVVGCTRKSPGCEHCYAETMAARNVLMQQALGRRSVYLNVVDTQRRRWTRRVELLPQRLLQPLTYPAGDHVFVCSMSDLFHADVPFEFILQVWAVMAATPLLTYQVLTKRPERLVEFLTWMRRRGGRWVEVDGRRLPGPGTWPDPLPNVWLGTSAEAQPWADERVPLLLEASAAVRYLSLEPLLGPIDLGRWLGDYDCHHCGRRFWGVDMDGHDDLVGLVGDEPDPEYPGTERTRRICPHCSRADLGTGDVGPVGGEYEDEPRIDWVIVGGESGPGARPIDAAWVRSLRDQCDSGADRIGATAFFFKQWGGVRKGKAGRVLDGRTHDAMPEVRHAA